MKNKLHANSAVANGYHLAFSVIHSFLMLGLLLCALYFLGRSNSLNRSASVVEPSKSIKTEYVYIEVDTDQTADTQNNNKTDVYTVREHLGKIGIFNSDGSLVRVLEVYTKTLPKADRLLLEEGFEVIGTSELNSVIEDYSS